MPHYAASYVPLVREAKVLRWDPDSQSEPASVTVSTAFALLALLKPKDHLWLMMGSTNAIAALAAFRKGAEVHQLSSLRVSAWLTNGEEPEQEETDTEEERGGYRTKVSSTQVLRAAQEAPHLFYPMSAQQDEVLEVVGAWNEVRVAMRQRLSSSNVLRASIHYQANVYGRVRGKQLSADPDEAQKQLEGILYDLLDTRERDEEGKLTGRKRKPSDPHIALLVEDEEQKRSHLERVCSHSPFYLHLFGDVEGVGSMIGARIIAAVERVERFARAKDLSNYGGMLPRGREGRLPSRRRSRGQSLSRSPRLNNAVRLFQDQMFQWSRHTNLGHLLISQVERECPCTPEARKADKVLARKHVEAVKRARVATTRHFLEKIVWPRWRDYMGLTS